MLKISKIGLLDLYTSGTWSPKYFDCCWDINFHKSHFLPREERPLNTIYAMHLGLNAFSRKDQSIAEVLVFNCKSNLSLIFNEYCMIILIEKAAGNKASAPPQNWTKSCLWKASVLGQGSLFWKFLTSLKGPLFLLNDSGFFWVFENFLPLVFCLFVLHHFLVLRSVKRPFAGPSSPLTRWA